MAKVSYETLFPDILPVVPACPDSLIERNIRSAVIEFCEKTGIYQAELDPLTTVSGIYEYDLEPPSGTVVHKIMNTVFDGKKPRSRVSRTARSKKTRLAQIREHRLARILCQARSKDWFG